MVTNMNAPMCLLISRTTYSHQENEVQPHEYQLLRGAPEMERRGQQQETEHGAAGAPRASLSEEVAHTDNFVGRCPYCDVRVGDAEEEDELFGKIKDSDGVDILRHDGAVISRIHFFIRSRRCADNSVKYLLGDPNSTFRTYIVYPAGNTRYMVERGILYPLAVGTKIYIHGFTPNSQKYILQFMTERDAITRLSSGGRRVPVPRNRDTIQTVLFPVRGTNTPPIVHEEAGGHTPGQQEVARRIRRRESSDEESDDGWRAIPPHKAQRLRQGSLAPRAQELEIGDEVEVCEKAEGYRGSWARARIVNFTKNKARCEVEYLDLDDDNTKKRYRVRMDVRSTKLVTVPNSGIARNDTLPVVVLMVRPRYPSEFVDGPPEGELWPKGTLVDARWRGLWWKGKVVKQRAAKDNEPAKMLVQFLPKPHGEGGPPMWRSMKQVRKALLWEIDHKAIQKMSEGEDSIIGSWADDTGDMDGL